MKEQKLKPFLYTHTLVSFIYKSELYWSTSNNLTTIIINIINIIIESSVCYRSPPSLSLHPCIPPFLSPSRQCIPIPHTVAVSSGESCLPCATGPTKRCCSRASPHRPEAEQTHGRKARTHTGKKIFFLLRQSDFGKSRPAVLSRRAGMSNVSTC